MIKVAFHNLGCKVNSCETDIMRKELLSNGYHVVPFDQKADVYIVNTCSVTNIADRKSRQLLHRAKAMNPDAVIVAAGCYVDTRKEEKVLSEGVDIAVPNGRKKDIADILNAYFKEERPAYEGNEEALLSKDVRLHSRAFIKCQDGCNMFCTYCIIPYARGRIKSRRIEDICEEIKGLVKEGFKEFVLTGIHICSFGLERKEDGETLSDLICETAAIDGVQRIRLSSLEPAAVTEDFIDRIKNVDKLCPHFHMSLQSGCDEVLKRMNRHYTSKEFAERVALLRSAFDDPAITTDIITGFPGETEEEFAKTLEFVEKTQFYETHVFKYSRRKGTVADRMEGQLPDRIKAERSAALLSLNKVNKENYIKRHINKPGLLLLPEEEVIIDKKRYLTGYTKEYIKAAVLSSDAEGCGRVIEGTVTEHIDNDTMLFMRTDHE